MSAQGFQPDKAAGLGTVAAGLVSLSSFFLQAGQTWTVAAARTCATWHRWRPDKPSRGLLRWPSP